MGRQIAYDFAKEGATVVAVARREERLAELAAQVEANGLPGTILHTRMAPLFGQRQAKSARGQARSLCYSCLTNGIAPPAELRLRREVNLMDLLIAILKLAAVLACLAAGIIRVLSAASKSKHDEKRKRVASGN